MTTLVQGILEKAFKIDNYGNVSVYDDNCANQVGHLQGWYSSRPRILKEESMEAYRIARDFLENFIIDTRNMLANLKTEDIVKLEVKNTYCNEDTWEEESFIYYAMEITDEKYAKYFDEYEGKKYLFLMTNAWGNFSLFNFFYESVCDEYSVKSFLDWQEGLIYLRCFPDGHYIRKSNSEDRAIIDHVDEASEVIIKEYNDKIDRLKKQIKTLENKLRDEISALEDKMYRDLPRATPEFDVEGFERTKQALLKLGGESCE